MSPFLIGNLIFAGLYITPVVLTYNGCYVCQTGALRTTKAKTWSKTGKDFRQAYFKAITACKKESEDPYKCDILYCEQKFFC